MVKMVLGSSDGQANSVSSLASNRMAAFQSTMDALTNFIATTNLTGNAYENAQQYAQSTLIPLLQAAILYEENLSTAVGKIPSEYRNTEHLGEDLDSEELEEELQALDMTRSSLMESVRVSEQHDLNGSTLNSNGRNTQSLRGQLRTVNQRREKIMQQLAALAAYSATSVTFFDGLTEVPSDLKSALAMVSGDMSSFSGKFPERKNIEWVRNVSNSWNEKNEVIKESYEEVLTKMNNGKQLSENDINILVAYAATNRNVELPDEVVKLILAVTLSDAGLPSEKIDEGIEEIWKTMKNNMSVGDITYEAIVSTMEEIAKNPSTATEVINTVAANLMNSFDEIAVEANNFFSITTSFGSVPYASSAIDDIATSATTTIVNVSYSMNSVAKFLSKNAGAIKAFAFIYDFQSQVSNGTSHTNAAIKTTAHVGIGWAAGEVGALAGAKIGAAVGTAIPIPFVGTVSGAVVGSVIGFAVGVGLSYVGSLAFDTIYDTYIGEHVDRGVQKTKEWLGDVGDAVGDWFGSLGSAIN
ncbi:hypothetical protein [Streptococcus pluranimalium]|uniref:LXG domain-containing protein n=1 Tax=Streptococcus pluranimalium TaxID=82348 RepID=A0A345VJK2_9STRE|nr:hypothetical protein [Streptococcus pluranimalium]AXJ12904.1 hypothetical protein Sp14A_09830 [Streptococcus pluranimalium]